MAAATHPRGTSACLVAGILLAVGLSGCSSNEPTTPPEEEPEPETFDESLLYDWGVANDGFQVRGDPVSGEVVRLGRTPANSASAADAKIVDVVDSDAMGAQDLADFLMDAQPEDGPRYQALLRSMLTGSDLGLPFDAGGGVAQNRSVFGATGIGPTGFPQTKAYFGLLGQAILRVNETALEGRHTVLVLITRPVHAVDGTLRSSPGADGFELHVFFPGRALGSAHAIPGQTDPGLYFFFTNVRLRQLGETLRELVGSDLVAAQRSNQPPVADAKVLVEGEESRFGILRPGVNNGNLSVVLDGTNSTDVDGNITVYSWEVSEFVNATSIERRFTAQGPIVHHNFSKVGWKLVTLRVIDDRFEPAEESLVFYVNYANTFSFDFGAGNPPLNAVGGGMECNDPVNCHDHQVTIGFGAREGVFTVTMGTGCRSPHQELWEPGASPGQLGDRVATGTTQMKADAGDMSKGGAYTLRIYFEAQADCDYSIGATVDYAPTGVASF